GEGMTMFGMATAFGTKVNPVPHKYHFLEADREHLDLVGLDGHDHDVDGLTYQHLQSRSKSQYRGELHSPDTFYLQSTGEMRSEVKARQKELMKKHAAYVQKEVGNIFTRPVEQ